MKKMKKLVSLLLAMVMTFAMASTVFATTGGDPTDPTDPTPTSTPRYQIYQIFTGDATDVTAEGEGTLSNVKWGQNGTGTQGEAVDEAILTALQNLASASDSAAVDVIKTYADLNSAAFATGNETTYTVPAGYYLVKDNPNFEVDEGEANTLYVVRVVNNQLIFQPKVGAPESEKKIVEGNNRVDANDAAIGDTITYEITGTIPDRFDDYKEYYYVFTDTLSSGLAVETNNDAAKSVKGLTVKVKNGEETTDVTQYFYNGTAAGNNGATVITVGMQNIKELLNTDPATVLVPGTEIIVTYDATLTENAVIGSDGNPNDVVLDYSRDPNNSGNGTTNPPGEPEEPTPTHPTGNTPKDTVKTYTTKLVITKWDATDPNNKVLLPGVEFTLTGEALNQVIVTGDRYVEDNDGEYWKLKDGTYTETAPVVAEDDTDNTDDYESITQKYRREEYRELKTTGTENHSVTGVVGEDGKVTFTGLKAGTYTLSEKVLSGYNDLDPITFEIEFTPGTEDTTEGTFSVKDNKLTLESDNTFSTEIENKKGSLLPSTGGIGTTIFYVVGTILVLGAGILLVTKRRMKAQ